ncbi:MAG: hypothetical protein HWN80_08445 [Candidatus Lokiarchaeota archaeon]|nr:hypothetical protein [Candidatus Lokiarchaeota archaeon]
MTRIRICPKCKNPTLKNAVNVSGWLAPNLFECTSRNCNYVGPLFLEIDPEDLKEEKNSFEDDSD